MNTSLPNKMSKGIGALSLLLASGIVCGVCAFASETTRPSIQLRVVENQLQVGTEVSSPYYIQWRTPDGPWQTWSKDVEIPSEISSFWMRGVFQPDDPTSWELPVDLGQILSAD